MLCVSPSHVIVNVIIIIIIIIIIFSKDPAGTAKVLCGVILHAENEYQVTILFDLTLFESELPAQDDSRSESKTLLATRKCCASRNDLQWECNSLGKRNVDIVHENIIIHHRVKVSLFIYSLINQ